jgi:predicted nucleic acid-binding protein
VVIEPSAFLGWFAAGGPGRRLRDEFERGGLAVIAPRGFALTVLEMAALQGTWSADQIRRLAAEIDRVGFELRDPPSAELALWLAKGLNGSQAAHAALASSLDLRLVTTDPDLLRTAASVAISPADA